MARVLITGYTARHIGSKKTKLDYLNFDETVLEHALVRAGHEVDRRPVVPGEDLSGYGRAVIYTTPLGSMGATYCLGALWAMHSLEGKHVLAVDDWRCHTLRTQHSLNVINRKFDGSMREHWNGWKPAAAKRDKIIEQVLRIGKQTPEIDRSILIPVYDNGDISKLRLACKDPVRVAYGRYHRGFYSPSLSSSVKKKQWVLAALSPEANAWADEQSFEWPVVRVGCKKLGQPQLNEEEIYRLYEESWGVLCPAYNHAGSGWYRVRNQMAADAGCIIGGDDSEIRPIYGVHSRHHREVELYSDSALKSLALAQNACFWSKMPTKSMITARICSALGLEF